MLNYPPTRHHSLAVNREGVELVVLLSDSKVLVAGADVKNSVGDRRPASDRAARVELPGDLPILRVVGANEVARRSRPHELVVSGPGDGDRAEVGFTVRAE